ncbi:hypothetical protein COCON_G00165110 [Conger conger]|uniref:CD8 beta n=1 Tax=Conger conger TaxID=82655 RepID=A0A9Q1D6W3_CONCO|nr:T-cell surface glycoprotein CD8 beta chain [Conger conger]KAJ8260788.1 hypothetical protein COCON_G00165110 [Conger conger]
MALLVHLWTAFVWIAVAVQSLQSPSPRYPKLGEWETLRCDCAGLLCQTVYWGRMHMMGGKAEFQFLFSHNQADRITHGTGIDASDFGGSLSAGSSNTYSLKLKVKEEHAGLYFCIVPNKRSYQLGLLARLLPGETPQAPPTTKTTTTKKKPCPCPREDTILPVKGCSFRVLWSLAGTIMGLALVLLATLLYFSRLPKKCRHQLVKK